jgi:hypothetical protein
MAEEMASSRPAAVDRAAARPPAATRAMTQLGSLAISGLARTMMSRSTLVSSLPSQPKDRSGLGGEFGVAVVVVLEAAVAVLVLPVEQTGLLPAVHPFGQVGDLDIAVSSPTGPVWMVSIRFRRAMAPTAGAVV